MGLLYPRLGAGEIADSVVVEDGVVADLDASGHPVAVEFLDAAGLLPFLARRGAAADGVIVDLPEGLAALIGGESVAAAS